MTKHKTGTREEWLAARLKLLKEEKELTRRSDELARRRQELPWVRIDKEYRFKTDEGSASLAELFQGRSQLLVYHFMFGYGFRLTDERRGCTGCSLIADHFDGVIPHLNGRDITLVCASIAPLQELQNYKRQMGWRFPWVSSLGSDFNYDFGVAFTEEQQRNGADYNYRHVDKAEPQKEGMSVFALQGGAVHHTYSTYARGTEALMGTYRFLDLAPWGRNEDGLEEIWWRRHDEYDSAKRRSSCRGVTAGGDLTAHGFRSHLRASVSWRLCAALRCQCGGNDRLVHIDVGDRRDADARRLDDVDGMDADARTDVAWRRGVVPWDVDRDDGGDDAAVPGPDASALPPIGR
jgi:predicted dithiol-disulfide oxidoreductase (DUF899 family)